MLRLNKEALTTDQVAVLRQWIDELDDTAPDATEGA